MNSSIRRIVQMLSVSMFFVTFLSGAASTKTQIIEWTELMPVDQLNVLLNPPEQLLSITEGSAQDSIDSLSSGDEAVAQYQSALRSADTIEAFNNKSVRIPGFVVPLDFGEDQRVTNFFLVPYFGACLHMPPPPPNQIIYVKSKQGIELENLYDPFWAEGVLSIALNENELGTSAYEMSLTNLTLYEETGE